MPRSFYRLLVGVHERAKSDGYTLTEAIRLALARYADRQDTEGVLKATIVELQSALTVMEGDRDKWL